MLCQELLLLIYIWGHNYLIVLALELLRHCLFKGMVLLSINNGNIGLCICWQRVVLAPSYYPRTSPIRTKISFLSCVCVYSPNLVTPKHQISLSRRSNRLSATFMLLLSIQALPNWFPTSSLCSPCIHRVVISTALSMMRGLLNYLRLIYLIIHLCVEIILSYSRIN